MEVVYLSRHQVGYDTSLPRLGHLVAPDNRDGFIEHHTVGGKRTSHTEAEALVYGRKLQTIRPKLGLDVPYNFSVSYISPFIGRDRLLVCEGRGWHRTGAHTAGHNTSKIAFGWQGDWDTGTAARLDDAQQALGRWAIEQANLEIAGHQITTEQTYGHRQFKDTACPGRNIWDTRTLFTLGMQEVEMTPEQEAAVNWLVTLKAEVERLGWTDGENSAKRLEYANRLRNGLAAETGISGDNGEAIAKAVVNHGPHGSGGLTEPEVAALIAAATASLAGKHELAHEHDVFGHTGPATEPG